MSSNTKLNTSDSENMCVVCFKNATIYSIGICDHPVCYECSTRMRVLCGQNECPICRQDMPKVIFCNEIGPFKKLKNQLYRNSYLIEDRKFGILFETNSIQREYWQLLEHNCKKCSRLPSFRNFNQLKDHMKREHELYYCDLCVENLRIFTWERKCYTRQDLAAHRRKGDIDDTSHRGHPLCEFCDVRYMDSDELFRHLRRDHLFCHFCDADGVHQYYQTYNDILKHFKEMHYVCEEGDCINEKFTSVFRSEIDLRAHKASVHSKSLGKAGTKQARTLELEFTLAPRPRPEPRGEGRGRKPVNPYAISERSEEEGAVGYDINYVGTQSNQNNRNQTKPKPEPVEVQLTAQDFPSLNKASVPAVQPLHPPSSVKITHYSKKNLTRNDTNFPALSGDSGSTVRVSVNSSVVGSQDRPTSSNNAPKVSIHVNHRSNGAITTHISSQNSGTVKIRPHSSKEFPALSSGPVPDVQWVKPGPSKEPKQQPKVHKTAPCPVLPPRNRSYSPTDFPSLGKSEKTSNKKVVLINSDSFENLKSKNTNNNSIKEQNDSSWTKSESKSKKNSVNVPISSQNDNLTKDKNQNINFSKNKNDFPALKNETKTKKSSVTVPMGQNDNTQDNKNKNTKNETKSSKKSSITVPVTNNEQQKNQGGSKNNNKNSNSAPISNGTQKPKNTVDNAPSTSKDAKKKNKKSKNNSENDYLEREANNQKIYDNMVKLEPKNSDTKPSDTPKGKNGVVKKRSELKIDPLQIENENVINQNEFPSLGRKLPPGISTQPPPGFAANDLTFVNSSGVAYSIIPQSQFIPPPNFNQRNRTLVEKFMSALDSNEKIFEFKQISNLFRSGDFSSESYYEHCKKEIGEEFPKIFPELLALLPDIQKQQELFKIHLERGGSKKYLDVCATCNQVVTSSDLRNHLTNHALENHFPVLGNQDISSVWKK